MASTPAAATKAETKTKQARRYFVVNPRGAIHEITRELARDRLRLPGWRMATSVEVEALAERNGHQAHDKPICAPWSAEIDLLLDQLDGEAE